MFRSVDVKELALNPFAAVGDEWMLTSFYHARKIDVTLPYKLKTVDLGCFCKEEKSLSKWQKTAI
jgi:hypothetical protein